MKRETGKIKWFSVEKGYGFIRRDEGGEIFVHATAVEPRSRPLADNDSVEFEAESTPRGSAAKRVTKV